MHTISQAAQNVAVDWEMPKIFVHDMTQWNRDLDYAILGRNTIRRAYRIGQYHKFFGHISWLRKQLNMYKVNMREIIHKQTHWAAMLTE